MEPITIIGFCLIFWMNGFVCGAKKDDSSAYKVAPKVATTVVLSYDSNVMGNGYTLGAK